MKVVVDIDNTLWDFALCLHRLLALKGIKVPPPEHWEEYQFYKRYNIPEGVFYKTVNQIHQKQYQYEPYPDAHEFLHWLKNEGFYIVIASHRAETYRLATETWLKKHRLVYNELHLSYDKSVLWTDKQISMFSDDSPVVAVVDDSPEVLESAVTNNILALGLTRPWNRVCQHKAVLKNSLMDIADEMKNRLTELSAKRNLLIL